MMKPRLIGAAVGLALALGFGAGAQAADEPYVALISKGFQHQFWQAVKKGAEKAGEDYHVRVTFEGPETEAMVDKQIDMLSAALAKRPAAIGFAALDSKAAIPLLKKAQQEKIPVIAFDSGVDSNIPLATAATDNKKAAALAADKMAQLIGDEGEVALVVHDQTSRTGIDRRDGFVDEMKAKHPKVKIVDIQYGAGDQLKSTEITKALLAAHPKIKGIFGANEGSVIGVIHGTKEMKMTGKVVIIGYDSGKEQKEAIRSGIEAGAITQNPGGIGYETVKAAVEAINGKAKQIPKVIDTGFYGYDKSNIDDPKIASQLYD
jgi:ribose transport system substrate-binding protein